MFGFILVAANDTVLLLIKGTNATLTTLSPIEFLTTCGTNLCLKPVLVWLTVVAVSISVLLKTRLPLLKFPDVSLLLTSLGVPVQKSCQSFQIVPISTPFKAAFPKPETNVSKPPWLFITNSGALSVSFHSSVGGVKSTLPTHVNTSNGFTLTLLLANGWLIKVC